jgi:hypothetical protein
MIIRAIFGTLIIAGGIPAQTSGLIKFEYHHIDNFGHNQGQTTIIDVDNDGDGDWIAGDQNGPISWWEYRGDDDWVRHSIGNASTDVGGTAWDINGDGWADQISGARIYLNPKNPRDASSWPEYNVGTISTHDNSHGDVNGDGKEDLIANSDGSGLFWYDIPSDPTQQWTQHMIISNNDHRIHGGADPDPVADIDGDGDNDVVTAEAWYENLNGQGTEWRQHKNIDLGESHQYGIAIKTWIGDLDHDGDADLIQAEADNPDSRVAWFENDGSGNWTRHMIKADGEQQDFHSLVVADFDLDGDYDVFSGGGPLSASGQHKCYIWENTAAKGEKPVSGKWQEHVISNKPSHEAMGGDVDGDGDIDICTKPWSTGNEHIFFKNMAVENGAGARPKIGLSRMSVPLQAVQGNAAASEPQTVAISNEGANTLTNVTAEADKNWVSLEFTDNEGDEQELKLWLNANAENLPPGSHTSIVEINADDAEIRTLTINFTVLPATSVSYKAGPENSAPMLTMEGDGLVLLWDRGEMVTLDLLGLNGMRIKNLFHGRLSAGRNLIRFNTADVPKGMCLLLLKTDGDQSIHKIIIR